MQLAERLLKTIRKKGLIKAGDRVAAAVSGGADSVALMLLLLELRTELGIVLSVAHVNHKLRGEESEADQRFVEELCQAHALELHCRTAPVDSGKSGIEAAARELRYQYFQELARANPGLKIATGHTLEDQAETVLLRLLRGTGIRGLAGIHPRIALEDPGRSVGEVVRPLLSCRRAELQKLLRDRGQSWREDSSNRDPKFLRNRVRHAVLPVLNESFGAAVIDNLADLAEIARAEDDHWEISHPEIRANAGELRVHSLLSMPLAAQRRLIRAWIKMQSAKASTSFRMIEDALELARSAPGKVLELTTGQRLRRTREGLQIEMCDPAGGESEYEYSLTVPGEVAISELGIRLQASIVNAIDVAECERGCLLDAARLPAVLVVRNWRAADRFWPAHTKEPRKVKELLSDRHVAGTEKKLWPVIVAGDELIWMRGFEVRADFQPQASASRALCIRETRT